MDAVIVGAGISGFLHGLALRAAGVEIGLVMDPNRERADLLAGLLRAGGSTSSFDTASAREFDVAAVCSPPSFHVAQAEALARPGRLVFVEKPVALDEGELERLRSLPGIVPVLQWRAGRAARELYTLVRRKAFGDDLHLTIDLSLWRDERYFEGGRRGRAQWGCGALLSIGIHAIDLATWIVGAPVESVSSAERYGRAWIDVPTAGEITLRFDDGSRADVFITLDAPGADHVRIAARGDAGSAELVGAEGDPTAGALAVRGRARADRAEVEGAGGASGSPLLVPFVKEALEAHLRGERTVSVDDVAVAHAAVFSGKNALPR